MMNGKPILGIRRSKRPPCDALTVRTNPAPVIWPIDGRAPVLNFRRFLRQILRKHRVIHQTFTLGQLVPPAVRRVRFLIGLREGNQLEIRAIVECHERVVRGPARMLASRQHIEPSPGVIARSLIEIANSDDDMIDLRSHD